MVLVIVAVIIQIDGRARDILYPLSEGCAYVNWYSLCVARVVLYFVIIYDTEFSACLQRLRLKEEIHGSSLVLLAISSLIWFMKVVL